MVNIPKFLIWPMSKKRLDNPVPEASFFAERLVLPFMAHHIDQCLICNFLIQVQAENLQIYNTKLYNAHLVKSILRTSN